MYNALTVDITLETIAKTITLKVTQHLGKAIFTALNADTMEIYTELVPFDDALAQRMSDRAVKVITATEAGELLPRAFHDPTHFECRMCAWQDRCWRTQE